MSVENLNSVLLGLVTLLTVLSTTIVAGKSCSYKDGCPYDHVWWLQEEVFSLRARFGVLCSPMGFLVSGGESSDGTKLKSTFITKLISFSTVFNDTSYSHANDIVRWTEIFPVNGESYSRVFLEAVGTTILALGMDSSNSIHVEMYVDEDRFSRWQEMSPATQKPTSRDKFGAVGRRNGTNLQLFVFFGATQVTVVNEVWVWEQSETSRVTGSWREIVPSGNSPLPRRSPCCAYDASRDYTVCFGGAAEVGDLSDLVIFDHNAEEWIEVDASSSAPSAPSVRNSAFCTIGNDVFYVMFGHSSVDWAPTQDNNLYVFNLATMMWEPPLEQMSELQFRYGGAMCKAFKGTALEGLYILGGASRNGHLNDVWRMSPGSDKFNIDVNPSIRPPARSFHSAVLKGNEMYIFFGLSANGLLNDMWSLHLYHILRPWSRFHTKSKLFWLEVAYEGSDVPSARYGQAAVLEGNNIYVFGGYTAATGDELNGELWRFDMGSRVWQLLLTLGNNKGEAKRAGHTPMIFTSSWGFNTTANKLVLAEHRPIILFYGGKEASGLRQVDSNSLLMYNTSAIHAVEFTPDSDKLDAAAFVPAAMGTGEALLFVTGKLYSITPEVKYDVQNDEFYATGKIAVKLMAPPNGMTVQKYRDVKRWGHGATTLGNHTFFCGGAGSEDAGLPDDLVCYVYNRGVNDFIVMNAVDYGNNVGLMPYPALGASFIAFEDKIFAFGGQLISSTRIREHFIDAVRFMTFRQVCLNPAAGTGKVDTDCVHCAPGSLDLGVGYQSVADWQSNSDELCQSAEIGAYAPISYEASEYKNCGIGLSNHFMGASSWADCYYCPTGSFRSPTNSTCFPCRNDSFCPIAASSEIRIVDIIVPPDHPTMQSDVIQDQPRAESSLDIPLLLIIVSASIVAFLLLLVIIIILMKLIADKSHSSYYFDEPTREKLNNIYSQFAIPGYGLDVTALYNALAHRELQIRDLSLDYSAKLFSEMDLDGSGYVDFTEFCCVLMTLMENGRMPLVGWSKSTPAQKEGRPMDPNNVGGVKKVLYKFRFSSFDQYKDSHRIGKNGDPLRLQQNNVGGSFTIFYYVAALALFLNLVIVFYYQNFSETTSLIPTALMADDVRGDFTVTAKLVMSYTYSSSSCIASDAQGNTKCAEGLYARSSGAMSAKDTDTYCKWVHHDVLPVCELTWVCRNCVLPFGAESTLFMNLNGAGQYLVVDVSVSTGVSNPFVGSSGLVYFPDRSLASKVSLPFEPLGGNEIRGDPATTFLVELHPVLFRGPRDVLQINEDRITGYIASLEFTSVRQGNSVSNMNYRLFYGVPIEVEFKTMSNAIYVERSVKQTATELVSSLLGAISGLSAAILVIVKHFDGRAQTRRQEEHDEAEEAAAAAAALRAAKPHTEEEATKLRRDQELLSGLLKARVNFAAAQEQLKLIRTVIREEEHATQTKEQSVSHVHSHAATPALKQQSPAKQGAAQEWKWDSSQRLYFSSIHNMFYDPESGQYYDVSKGDWVGA